MRTEAPVALIFLVIFGLLPQLGAAELEFNGTWCGNIVQNMTLVSNVTVNGSTCFVIDQPNTWLDCKGRWIVATGFESIGVKITDKAMRAQVRNCYFNTTSGGFWWGVESAADNVVLSGNTFIINGNATYMTGVGSIFTNSTVWAILGGNPSMPPNPHTHAVHMYGNHSVLANSTLTAVMNYPQPSVLDFRGDIIDNSTIRSTGSLAGVADLYPLSGGAMRISNTFFKMDGTNGASPGGVVLYSAGGPLSRANFTNCNISVTDLFLQFGLQMPVHFYNTSYNFQKLLVGIPGSFFVLWPVDVKVIYADGSPCRNCFIYVTNVSHAAAEYGGITDEQGYVRGWWLTQMIASTSSSDANMRSMSYPYWLLTGNNYSFGITSMGGLEYVTPHTFTARKGNFTGVNETEIKAAGTVVVVVPTVAPPEEKKTATVPEKAFSCSNECVLVTVFVLALVCLCFYYLLEKRKV